MGDYWNWARDDESVRTSNESGQYALCQKGTLYTEKRNCLDLTFFLVETNRGVAFDDFNI